MGGNFPFFTSSDRLTSVLPSPAAEAVKDAVTPSGIFCEAVTSRHTLHTLSIFQPRSLSIGARQRLTRNAPALAATPVVAGAGTGVNGLVNWSCASIGRLSPFFLNQNVIASPSGAATDTAFSLSGAKPERSRRPLATTAPSLLTIQIPVMPSSDVKR